MDTPQVIDAVARRAGLDPLVVDAVLHALQSVVTEQLVHGCPVRLTGFVSFSTHDTHSGPPPHSHRTAPAPTCQTDSARSVRVRPGTHLCRVVEGS